MFDHIGVAVSDLPASERFYRTVLGALGIETTHGDPGLVEWEDWAIGPTDGEHPVTRGLEVGFRARDRARAEAFQPASDPDGNSVEVVHDQRAAGGNVARLSIRVRDPQVSLRFYTTIAPYAGLRVTQVEPDRVQLAGTDVSLTLVNDGRPLSENVHIAFPADADATVRAFHAAAVGAGYIDNGPAGERAVYHPGYYGAFVLDPDGHNVEVVNHNEG